MSKDNKVVRPFGLRDKVGYMFGDFGNDFTFMLSSIFMLKTHLINQDIKLKSTLIQRII